MELDISAVTAENTPDGCYADIEFCIMGSLIYEARIHVSDLDSDHWMMLVHSEFRKSLVTEWHFKNQTSSMIE